MTCYTVILLARLTSFSVWNKSLRFLNCQLIAAIALHCHLAKNWTKTKDSSVFVVSVCPVWSGLLKRICHSVSLNDLAFNLLIVLSLDLMWLSARFHHVYGRRQRDSARRQMLNGFSMNNVKMMSAVTSSTHILADNNITFSSILQIHLSELKNDVRRLKWLNRWAALCLFIILMIRLECYYPRLFVTYCFIGHLNGAGWKWYHVSSLATGWKVKDANYLVVNQHRVESRLHQPLAISNIQ